MDIRNTRALKSCAAARTAQAEQERKITFVYAGLTIGLAALVTVILHLLGLQMDQAGGLSNLSIRTVLSALQTTLSLLHPVAMLCLELGYLAAMLRIARGQYASPGVLKLGFERFWTLLRCLLFQIFLFGGLAVGSVYFSSVIFVMSPWGQPFMELMSPALTEVSLLNQEFALDETLYLQALPTMLPMFAILAVVFGIIALPLMYQYRMVNYIIIDKPSMGAWQVLTLSRKIMKGHCLKLLKLDLSFWWYYLILVVISLVSDGTQWLALLGVQLPLNETVVFFLFYGVYLALTFVAYSFLRSKLEVTYALAYDAIKPEEPKTDGVVLGNIFQM